MSALWGNDPAQPLLLLNATSANRGDRILAGNVQIAGTDWVRTLTPCRLNLVEEVDPPLSASIGASARFPFVSDWGWIRSPRSPGCNSLEGVADGGFFDNYGAATLLDLLDGLSSEAGGSVDLRKHVRLVVIQITSDPATDMGCVFRKLNIDNATETTRAADDCLPASPSKRLRSTGDERAPLIRLPAQIEKLLVPIEPSALERHTESLWNEVVRGFLGHGEPSVLDVALRSRSVTGVDVAERLRERACANDGAYYHFAMTGVGDIPLGWTLSTTSQERLSALLDKDPTAARLKRMIEDLRHAKGRGQC
jgi:hypothetical protein